MKSILRSSAGKLANIVAIFIIAIFPGHALLAQTVSYSFTYFTDEAGYHDLTDDSVVCDPVWGAWGGGGFVGFNDADLEIPLGFNFRLFEQTTNKLFVMRDATVLSGLREPDSAGNTDLYNLLCPMQMPVFDRAWAPYVHHMPGVVYDSTHPGFLPLSPISYKTDGIAPNRITRIQYKNVGFVADVSGLSYINFQVWLYEQGNIIEFRYGPQVIDPSIFIPGIFNDSGLIKGAFVSLTNDRRLGSCSSPSRAFEVDGPGANPHLEYFSSPVYRPFDPWPFLQGVPPNRMIYRFAPYLDTASTPIDSTTLVSGQSLGSIQFSVTPNPASSMITINHKGIDQGIVTLFDMTGKLIWRKELAAVGSIDVSGLAQGMYLVCLVSRDSKVYTARFSKR